RSVTALPDLGASHQGSPSAVLAAQAAEAGAAPGGSQPGSGGHSPQPAGTPRSSGIVNAGAPSWRSAPTKLHRHSTSATQEATLSRQGTLGSTAEAAAAAAAADAALLAASAELATALAGGNGQGSITSSLQLGRSGGLTAFQPRAGPPGLERLSSSALGAGRLHRPTSSISLASEDSLRPPAPASRKVRFVHVKINRAHCRATYEGYPLTFNDLKLVIDNRTYSNIDGRWRDLFNKMKWDTVKSVVKSVAGLQGRKFKELLPEGLPGEGDGEGGARRKLGLLQQLKELGKSRRDGGGVAAGEPGLSEEELRAQHKRRMLFGQANPRSAASTPMGAPAAEAGATTVVLARGGSSSGQEGSAVGSPFTATLSGGAAAAALASAQADLVPAGEASAARCGAQPSGGSRGASAGPSSPQRRSVDEVAAVGEVFAAPVAAPPQAAGPLGRGLAYESLEPFGSSTLLAPEVPDPGPLQAAADAPAAASAEAPLPMPQPPWPASVPANAASGGSGSGSSSGSGTRTTLSTPRWAKQLASKAQKGLHKLRDSLQE
ncbi:hypothetical protein ABPG77_006342, partial [Micractinium sp. CCAP 211/92]